MTVSLLQSNPHRVGGRTHGTDPTLVPVRAGRWRVLDEDGRIIGHLDDVTDGDGARFRAARYRRASGTLVSLGEFCRRADAIDALRYAR